jgi:hypothetical protein
MALATLAGLPVERARINLPRVGVGHADVIVGASSGIAAGDPVTLAVANGMSLVGTATKAQAHEGALRVRFVLGAAGAGTTATAKFYRGARASLVLADLLAVAGESQSTTIDADLLATLLPAWSAFARPVSVEIATLLSALPAGTAWRVLEDGTVWIGAETWPAVTPDRELVERDAERGRVVYAVPTITLLPGVTVDDWQIDRVEHVIAGDRVTSTGWTA